MTTQHGTQLEAILIAQAESERESENSDVHVWGLPEELSLLRLGQARMCSAPSLGNREIVYHVASHQIGEHYYCDSCGESTVPEA